MTPENLRTGSFAKRVFDSNQADVVLVPFFATLSAEMQLSVNRGVFKKKVTENLDYRRQKEMIDLVKSSDAWIRSGGRDHVFVLTGCDKPWGIIWQTQLQCGMLKMRLPLPSSLWLILVGGLGLIPSLL